MELIRNYINSLPGYKVSDSHFKLGSKIHIADFYYAKRMFQNSFFANRYALLTAEYILEKHELIFTPGNKEGVTLIGYGHYSALLLNLIERLLSKKIQSGLINHGVINDYESLRFVDAVDIKDNVIIIVPIASTFSTSIKIFEKLRRDYPRAKILEPDVNILFVSNGKDEENMYKSFGITRDCNANLELKVQLLSDGENNYRNQKYFTELSTKWYNNNKCEKCGFDRNGFYQSKLNEVPLYSTDESSVTPSVVFNFPYGREIEYPIEEIVRPKLNKENIDYGHLNHYNNRVSIAINIEQVFKSNKSNVEDWLEKIKEGHIQNNGNVLLVAAGHPSNTDFVYLINTILFNSSANVLHFSPEMEHLQNFELIYSSLILNSNQRYFIDTELSVGNCFNRINYYIKSIFNNSIEESDKFKGFDGCFFLLNRSSHFNFENVRRNITQGGKIFSWLDFQLPVVKPFNQLTPLEEEQLIFDKMYENIHIQRIKNYCLQRCIKYELRNPFPTDITSDKLEKGIYFTIANQILFNFFKEPANCNTWKKAQNLRQFLTGSFGKKIEDLPEGRRNEIDEKFNVAFNQDFHTELMFGLIKALCYSPFKNYIEITNKMMPWILNSAKAYFRSFRLNKIVDNKDYDLIKFYIRRLAILDSNFLISEDFFKSIDKIIIPNNDKSKELIVFVATQIKYLISANISKTINLEMLLREIYYQNCSNKLYKQFLRILIYENSSLFNAYEKYLVGKKIINAKNDETFKYLVVDTRRKSQLEEFQSDQVGLDIMENVLCIYNYFYSEKGEGLIERIRFLESELNKIVSTILGNTSFGTFLLVTNKSLRKEKSFFKAFDTTQINFHPNTYEKIYDHLDAGYNSQHENKTIIEFYFIDGKWVDIQSVKMPSTGSFKESEFSLNGNHNHILLIKIVKNKGWKNHESNEMQGVIGIAYIADENKAKEVLNPFLVRYLIWMCKPLSSFIEVHMENEEFQEWQEMEERKRLANLAGHGREMLLSISKLDLDTKNENYKNKFSSIFLHLEHIQLLMQFDNLKKELKDTENHVKFNQFYKYNQRNIDKAYFVSIEDMARQMMRMVEIEDNLDGDEMKVECKIDVNLLFSFSPVIIDIILFELILNAKKNRYLFKDNSSSNKLFISAVMKESKLEIKVTNTFVFCEISKSLTESSNDQNAYANYGLKMIKSLLITYDLGTIEFSVEQTDEDLNLGEFSATLILNPNPQLQNDLQ